MTKFCYAWAVVLTTGLSSTAVAQSKTPAETYLAYHKAFVSAKEWKEVFPFMRAKDVAKADAQSAKDKKDSLEFAQIFISAEKDLKIVSEKTNGEKSTVITSYCSEGKKGKATVQLVVENGAWKIAKNSGTTSANDKC